MRYHFKARVEAHLDEPNQTGTDYVLLSPALLQVYLEQVKNYTKANRGTSHISVIDENHNVAAMTISNGEGCGVMVPGTGIMLNNMLGEEDLNPGEFHRWHNNQRMTSMMAPSIINKNDGAVIALGSGGSNRIRTAILQTIINLLDFDLSLPDAVNSPRLHYENGFLNIEAGYNALVLDALLNDYSNSKCWDSLNLYFDGVHAVAHTQRGFEGAGDSHRDGVSRIV